MSRLDPSRGPGELLALCAGAGLTLAFAPYGLHALAVGLPAVLLWLLDGASPRRAAQRGALFGLGLFGAGIPWIFVSLHRYGSAPAVFAAAATAAVIVLMSAYPAAFGYLLARLSQRPGPVRWLLAAPALWVALEWVRSWLFTGFPWLSLGYSQLGSPLGGFAPVLGVFGVGGLVMMGAGLLRGVVQARGASRRLAWAAGGLVLGLAGWGLGQVSWVQPTGATLEVAVVQGSVPQEQKFRPEALFHTLDRYVGMSREARGVDVIVWPETAVPVLYADVADGFVAPLQAELRARDVDLITGIPDGSWDSGVFYNAVMSLGETRRFYHKRRLLPFGEYLPLRGLFEFFHRYVDIPMSDFSTGADEQPLLRAGGEAVGASICFEAAFGAEIRKSLPGARWLVNVSNDAWFGDSLAPHQHLEIARMRALEAGRYLVRATNTGVSAIIDARGRVLAAGPQFEPAVVRARIRSLAGATPYAVLGDAAAVGLAAVLLLVAAGLERRRRTPGAMAVNGERGAVERSPWT